MTRWEDTYDPDPDDAAFEGDEFTEDDDFEGFEVYESQDEYIDLITPDSARDWYDPEE